MSNENSVLEKPVEVDKAVSNVFAMFGTDANMEKTGIWLDYGPFRIRVARAGGSNHKFSKALEIVSKPYRRAIEREILSEEKGIEILVTAYARGIILGWDGVTDENGVPLDCTEKNIIWLLTKLPDLFKDIQEQASKFSNFQLQDREDDAKN